MKIYVPFEQVFINNKGPNKHSTFLSHHVTSDALCIVNRKMYSNALQIKEIF